MDSVHANIYRFKVRMPGHDSVDGDNVANVGDIHIHYMTLSLDGMTGIM